MRKFLPSGVILAACLLLSGLVAGPQAEAASITRSNNTTTYSTNTGWNNGTATYFTFPVAQNQGQQVYIREIDIYSSKNPSTKLQGVLWLFNSPPTTIVADDATFNISAADFANLVGGENGTAFTLASAQASGAANSGVTLAGSSFPLEVSAGSNGQVYGMVQVVNAYVPAANEVLTINILTDYRM